MRFSDQVRIFRTLKGMSQRELGQAVGVSYTTISQIENGYSQPSEEARAALVKVLDITEERVSLLGQLAQAAS